MGKLCFWPIRTKDKQFKYWYTVFEQMFLVITPRPHFVYKNLKAAHLLAQQVMVSNQSSSAIIKAFPNNRFQLCTLYVRCIFQTEIWEDNFNQANPYHPLGVQKQSFGFPNDPTEKQKKLLLRNAASKFQKKHSLLIYANCFVGLCV